ncbi:DUF1775 domain-containing protein [Bradyrhizobium sp. U87765 SZCCT0131]|uniref:DUF1775 domain-containing protein n=1 Tax=unclassified Bradyrhizobium TaxID=2631580 RepID=UPI001BAD9A48|nr:MULTISPECIES: DUF1775 domain-containing protein [unclassified Bradyrhizobium]MBR1220110.1 DUF1775 domain-containing protein [Bradyrhizobium sp. U87765 SZCCT0131]MBR1263434.1 DUF1775 domain-containing protein [Bradyrhizobium sp. U87765 SZCCT0134]MBR1309003.1 DUF1775 domain-containing protein [Bradyrhizobium sp. U87765 SZCCT0110]MBR1323766.1 DUF1775 domain-containing protein [Bradyrhizobium sp. U87765 SZCCT0109]MBR1349318.1 DUF1775 domain-containing protein [Bradyrhizobium sp. U87765 SZCCT004
MTDLSRGCFRPLLGLSGAALALAVSHTAAFAHVTLATSQAQPNSYYKAVLQVPHGCGSEATQTLRVQIPDGVYGVKPMPKAGWTLATTRGEYAKPYQSHGETMKEGVKEIVWSGGSLSSDNYDEFVFVSFLSGDLKPGQAIYFPTVQQCAKGEARWVDVPADQQSPHDLKTPAPQLRIVADTTTAQAQMDHSGHAGMDMSTPATTGNDIYKAGDLTITAPWTRATPGGAKIGGGYLKITNNGKSVDRFVGGSAPFAGRVEIHEMSMTDGVMKMRPLPNGLEIKPGETVELKPGGFHVMFMDLKQPFKQGDSLKTTLEFEKAGKVDVNFSVNGVGAGAGQQHQH